MQAASYNKIGSEAVQNATGKGWDDWLALLDKAGCQTMTHKEIVAVLSERFDVGPWWRQMVTVGYEQARGLRVKHQKTDGYSISRSKTIAADLADVYAAWKDKHKRRRWLADPDFTVRKANENQSLRITWIDRSSKLDVQFFARRKGKCQVAVEHARLGTAQQAATMKAYWGAQLDNLKTMLEG